MYETRFIRKEFLSGNLFAEIDIEVNTKENTAVFEIDFDSVVPEKHQLEFVNSIHSWMEFYQGISMQISARNHRDGSRDKGEAQ